MSTEEGKHGPHSYAQPVKPALLDIHKKSKKEKKALTWDEHAIEEHDLLRGTRMKIDEPNTPYHFEHSQSHSDNESESSFRSNANSVSSVTAGQQDQSAINWNHLQNKLGAVAAAREICPPSPSASSVEGGFGNSSGPDSDVEGEKKKRTMKKKEFDLHRKSHYNEMEALKRWRSNCQDDDDDDDDDMDMDMDMDEK